MKLNPEQKRTLTVCYDGSCPLCLREINLYRRSAGSETIEWQDVSTGNAPLGLTPEAAMKRFHVQRADGTWVSGAAAFIALWLSLPNWRWLGRVSSVPPLPWLLEAAYCIFLPLRPFLQMLARRSQRQSLPLPHAQHTTEEKKT